MLWQLRSIRRSASNSVFHSLVVSSWLRQRNTRRASCFPAPSPLVGAQCRRQPNTSTSWYEHVTPMLQDLQWLQSPECIDFKLAVFVYWCLHGLVPRYLSNYIQRVADSICCHLQSSSSSQLVVRRTRLSTIGNRVPVTASRLWNSLPPDVTLAPTLTVFWNRLKTYLFPDHFLPNCFRFLVLYTVYSSGLAVHFRPLYKYL